LYHEIVRCAEDVGVGMVGVRTIERINILQASRLAMMRAIGHLRRVPDVLLTDAMRIGGPWQEIPIVHGDALSASIAAASIVAKVVRDRYMEALAEQFPVYGFAQHKGYPTTYHREMLKHYGPSPVHRVTFLKKILSHDAIG
ncbi:MAG: ribonuclease HII, partial [Sulfobacillus thermotolerans]|nr:ribonuclease HII [Sulfobacillus thermotolerans]